MSKLEEKVNEILGVDTPTPEQKEFQPPVERKTGEVEVKIEKDINTDYDYSRDSYYNLIEKGQEAINGILEIAQESEMPRAYEVAGQLIKNVSDATDKLLDLQKKLKDVNEQDNKGPTSVTNNALFVGSTADLQKMLKKVNQDINT